MIDLVGCYTLCQAVLVVTHFRSRGLQNHREFFSEWHVYNGLCFPVTVQVFHTHKNHVSHNPATEALLHHRVFFFHPFWCPKLEFFVWLFSSSRIMKWRRQNNIHNDPKQFFKMVENHLLQIHNEWHIFHRLNCCRLPEKFYCYHVALRRTFRFSRSHWKWRDTCHQSPPPQHGCVLYYNWTIKTSQPTTTFFGLSMWFLTHNFSHAPFKQITICFKSFQKTFLFVKANIFI